MYRKSVVKYMNRLGICDVLDAADLAEFGELVSHNGVLTTLKHPDQRPWVRNSLLFIGIPHHRQVIRYINKNLKYLAYFNPHPNLLKHTLAVNGMNLTVLVLRGCGFIEEIGEEIGTMSALTVLEISGPFSLIKKIPDFFSKLIRLRSLNLSGLSSIETLPKIFLKLVDLRRLILRGCSSLTKLPSTKNMVKIEVIDLYGASSLRNLTSTKLNESPVQMLDLSHTLVCRVPRLFALNDEGPSMVTHLFLRNCLQISVFDIVDKLVHLQVLDLSGAKRLKYIKTFESLINLIVLDLSQTGLHSLLEDGLRNMNKLEHLNLSNTYISSLPPISHLSCLLRLIVRGCESLQTLEMKGLVNLEVLDASGCKMLHRLGDLNDLNKLKSLDLSGCGSLRRVDLQHMSALLSLNLTGTNIDDDFSMDSFEKLEILSLSETSIHDLASVSHLKSLKQLFLAELTKLEVLNLSETNIGKEFLDHLPISLKKLLLRDCHRIKGSIHLESLPLLNELDLQGSGLEEFPYDIKVMTHLKCLGLPQRISIVAVDWDRINAFLPQTIFWDQSFNVFKSIKFKIPNGVEHSMSATPSNDSHFFRLVDNQDSWEAYFNQFHFSTVKDSVIDFGGVELVFRGHHPLARKEPYFKPQSPSVEIHGFSSFPTETKTALEKAVNVALVANSFLSSLSDECFGSMEAMKVCWINSCTNLESVNANVFGNLETLVLSNLASLKRFCGETSNVKHVYIDCCPVLNNFISPSDLPKNLETLHIKFCDELETFCNGDSELQNLHELSLLGLPKLQQIGPNLTISQCPEFNVLGRILESAGSRLTRLSLDSCPQLVHVLSSSMVMENIQELEIRSCDNLTVVFDSAEASSTSLNSLIRLQLWNLPKLKSIGGGFPSLEACEIKYCSRLPHELWPQVKTQI
ncbi:hypothetical protein V2J09_005340 [Rumex salicifolius]